MLLCLIQFQKDFSNKKKKDIDAAFSENVGLKLKCTFKSCGSNINTNKDGDFIPSSSSP